MAAVKMLTYDDHQILLEAAKGLPLESRARILPEERLEAALLLGDSKRVTELVQKESNGLAEARQAYLYQQASRRNPNLIANLHTLYNGRCQICRWNPLDIYNHNLCHGHHIHWLSRGGADVIGNLILVCPNHHAAIHKADAPLDYSDLSFDFGTHREQVQIDHHLTID
jgi:5-methylcytosine-specific restriction enzyme A